MTNDHAAHDPLEFVRGMWSRMGFSLPGMVTPTLDVDELDKRIGDMRAVEGWLKMNLSMLQMAIQGLDVQRAAIAAVRAVSETMSQPAAAAEEPEPAAAGNPFMWWQAMNTQPHAAETEVVPVGESSATDEKPRTRRKTSENASK
jgi:hypothetical protein